MNTTLICLILLNIWQCASSQNPESQSICPQAYPYVYYNGDYCCAHDTEKVYTPDGELCDGGPIGFDSLCCLDDAHQQCSGSPCSDYIDSCGQVYDAGTPGQVTSPGYPNHYSNSIDSCVTIIRADQGQIIQLTFEEFNLEDNAECQYDYVEIRDGDSSSSQTFGREKYCGTSSPGIITSTGNSLWIKFHSDGSETRSGFSAHFALVSTGDDISFTLVGSNGEASGAEGFLLATVNSNIGTVCDDEFTDLAATAICQEMGYATSESWSNSNLWPNVQTQYDIVLDNVNCQTESFEDCNFDTTHNCGHSEDVFLTCVDPPADSCGQVYDAGTPGQVTSPGYPNHYSNSIDSCVTIIRADQGQIIQLTFEEFNLEDSAECQYDYVEIRDGDSSSSPTFGREKYCGTSSPEIITSTGNSLWIKFHSDGSQTRAGFSAHFVSVRIVNTCARPDINDGTVSPSTATVEYLGTYTVVCDTGHTVSAPGVMTCQADETLDVTHTCDIDLPADSCGQVYDAGTFRQVTSPGYPNHYSNSIDSCVTIIRADQGQIIQLTFEEFNLEDDAECRYDYVEIRDGDSSTSPTFGREKYCGTSSPEIITSTGNSLWISFHSDGSETRSGFSALVTFSSVVLPADSCGQVYDAGTPGQVTSPGYPNHYSNSIDSCVTIIRADQGQIIQLTFEEFDLEYAEECGFDYVEIRDGDSSTSPTFGREKYCGTSSPGIITSTGNSLWLKFHSDGSVAKSGFSAHFALFSTDPPNLGMSFEQDEFELRPSVASVNGNDHDGARIVDGDPATFARVDSAEEYVEIFLPADVELSSVQVFLASPLYLDGMSVEALRVADMDIFDDESGLYKVSCELDSRTESGELVVFTWDCGDALAAGIGVTVQPEVNNHVSIAEIKMFGEEVRAELGEAQEMPTGDGDDYATDPWIVGPTVSEDDVMINNVPEIFKSARADNYNVVWEIDFDEEIPYGQFMSSRAQVQETESEDGLSLMSYLAEGGYIDYVLTDEIVGALTSSGTTQNKRTKIDKIDIIDSVMLLQKVNGFPETGEVSREILDFVAKPRCGVSDVEYTTLKGEQEEARLCYTLIKERGVLIQNDFYCNGLNEGTDYDYSSFSMCGFLPLQGTEAFIQDDNPYKVDIDLMFDGNSWVSWEQLASTFVIFYNYYKNDQTGESGWGDRIKLFATEDKFGFEYQRLTTSGAPVWDRMDHYQLSKTQLARREFKIRIDVDHGSKAYLLINGEDIGVVRYQYPMKSAAVIQYTQGVPDIITARICNDPPASVVRAKRYSTSIHKWGTNEISYNFQNYSTSLGEAGTRRAVRQALEILTSAAPLKFHEHLPHEPVMLTFMFIKGKHADGMAFHSAGAEKAHAFSPVHSEIHFNDYEQFSVDKTSSSDVSLFYVALHEVGHALGLQHSDYRNAIMNSGYKDDAFDVTSLHRDDSKALRVHYPGSGTGEILELSDAVRASQLARRMDYQPKLPLPRECLSKIDAAFAMGTSMYLISNTFIWQYQIEGLQKVGSAQRLSDVLAGWNYVTRAAFTVGTRLYVLGDQVAHVYKQFGSVFVVDRNGISTVNAVLNNKKSNIQYPAIRSAFTISDGNTGFLTTLVTGNTEHYKVYWKNSKSIDRVERTEGTRLLGKEFQVNEFNAAVAYERFFRKTLTRSVEVYKFDKKYVKSVQVYPEAAPRSADPYQEVSVAFGIDAWCVQ